MKTTIENKINELTQKYLSEVIEIRRHIHANPELSFNEVNTSKFIASKLAELGIEYKTGFAEHGILGIIKGEQKGKTIALRADMDALPIVEENEFSYKSKNKGVMHACGHDIHTACLLGAAKILNELKAHIKGTVLLVFQPGEELIPGGAKVMMEDGLFDDYQPDMIFGQHVYPQLEAGQIGMKSGNYMASADEIYITLKGKGGHAALPHNTIDTVLMASQTVVSLQQIVSRFIPTQIPSVLSFGNIVCNSVMNVIPETVELQGTFRIMNEEWRYKAHKKIKDLTESIAQGMGGGCDVDIKIGFPCLFNNEKLTEASKESARDFIGEENVRDLDIRMTAEDFAWFAQKYPACFYRLGVGYSDGQVCGGLHTAKFNPNEKAIETGMSMMAYLALMSCE
ncbi:MAG: amidohydrolase [Salinivirgaceae bacterium]|nr:amidohydrolase [Salinivirgaceae bacterium]